MVQWKNRSRLLIIFLVILLSAVQPEAARADVGVPPAQPGSSLSPGDFETNVQMVSEVVEINIQKEPHQALINATFQMRNNGAEDEEFDVWFPYGEKFPNSKGTKIIQAKDFRAWLDGEEVEITIEKSDQWNLIWAHWNVRFPAGTPLEISVSYRIQPNFLENPAWWGNFIYIMETGAGWQGVIEKAEISVTTPYPLDELDNLLGIGDVFYARPGGFDVRSDGIQWTFENLEPTEEDNIIFVSLPPRSWYGIYDSLAALEKNPGDWKAYQDLADGLNNWKYGQSWAEGEGLADPFTEMDVINVVIVNSYLKVLELSPADENRYSTAMFYLSKYPEIVGGDQLEELFLEGMELFPEYEHLRDLYEDAKEDGLFEVEKLTVNASPTAAAYTPTAEFTPEAVSGENSPPASLNLVMGILFIAGAAVLLVIAIRRRGNQPDQMD